ncbi:RNA cap guanine-N2 methyltransferase [Aureococcus anophagefferens]|nr:RNA cap guanine-N2 methyltransferase [Aureococcus anophagefferens]
MGDVQHDEPHKKHHHHRHASQPRPFAIVDIRSDDEPAHDASCEDTLSEYCVGARANPLQADAGTPAPARGRKTAVSLEVRGDAAAAAARAGAAAHRRLPRPVPGGRRVADDEPEGAPGGRGRGARGVRARRDALRAAQREVAVATLRRSLDRYDEAGPGRALAPRGRHARAGVGVASNGGFTHGYGDDLLAPRVAAVVSRRGFGEAPFTWRAAAMVRLEERLQFMDGHRDDFERFGYEAWGRREFDYWLRDERNGAFRAQFEAAAPGARAALYGLCLEPFERMEALKTWDWRHTKASTYLYLACLGSGVASVLGTLLLQWGIPVVVFLFEIRHGRGSGFPALCADPAATVQDRGEGARFTSAMILLVVFFYAAKVAPDAYAKFLGDPQAATARSRSSSPSGRSSSGEGYTTSGIFERYVIYRGDQWDAHLFPADAAAGGARLGGLPYDHLEGFENFPRFRAFVERHAPRTAARINRRPRLGDLLKTASLQRVYQAARGRAGDGAVIEDCSCCRRLMMTADALVEVANAMVVLFGFPLVLLAVLAWVPLCYGPERSW